MALPLLYVSLMSIALVVAAYLFHRRVAPRPPATGDKKAPYACGELLPPQRMPVRILLYKYMCLFLTLDIIALLSAFTLGAPPEPLYKVLFAVYGLTALAAVLVAVEW